jgi:hypothetical protein
MLNTYRHKDQVSSCQCCLNVGLALFCRFLQTREAVQAASAPWQQHGRKLHTSRTFHGRQRPTTRSTAPYDIGWSKVQLVPHVVAAAHAAQLTRPTPGLPPAPSPRVSLLPIWTRLPVGKGLAAKACIGTASCVHRHTCLTGGICWVQDAASLLKVGAHALLNDKHTERGKR